MNSKTKWDAATERQEEQIRRRSDRLFNDTTFDWLRTPLARQVLVAVYIIAASSAVIAWWLNREIVGVSLLIVWFVLLLALRISVRTEADLPDYVLDERQRAERDQSMVTAYRATAGVVFFGTATALIAVVARNQNGAGEITLGYGATTGIFWGAAALLFGAPSIALALQQSHRAPAKS
jgi:hypothetical protein